MCEVVLLLPAFWPLPVPLTLYLLIARTLEVVVLSWVVCCPCLAVLRMSASWRSWSWPRCLPYASLAQWYGFVRVGSGGRVASCRLALQGWLRLAVGSSGRNTLRTVAHCTALPHWQFLGGLFQFRANWSDLVGCSVSEADVLLFIKNLPLDPIVSFLLHF